MARLGTVTLQSNDETDVFLVVEVIDDSLVKPDEVEAGIEELGFDSDKPWSSGKVPKPIAVKVSGDSAIINGWFKGIEFEKAFTINIYVEYEEMEQLYEIPQ